MYQSIGNQMYHLIHFGIASIVAFVIIPLYMFWPVVGTRLDRTWANFLRMCLFLIIVGYILVVLKLMEFIGLAGAIAMWTMLRKRRDPAGRVVSGYGMALFYDIVESPYIIRQWIRNTYLWVTGKASRPSFLQKIKVRKPTLNLSLIIAFIVLCVLGISLYMRIADALRNPAPAMSDGYVALAWLKYVNERILFHDGIYPQGYYFVMDTIEKFSFINPLYIIRYTGPFVATTTVYCFYYVISRMSNNGWFGGIVAATIFGVFGESLLGSGWVRQAATNSQEFGFLFILPTAYFFYRYIRSGETTDLTSAFAGLSVTGLVHEVAYALNVLGCISVVLAMVTVVDGVRWKRVWLGVTVGFASGILSVMPLGLGLVFGKKVNSSAQGFADNIVNQNQIPTVHLHSLDIAGVLSFSVLVVLAVIERVRGNEHPEWMFAGVFGLIVFCLWYYGGAVTQSEVVIVRTIDMWALVAPFSIGMSIQALIHYLPRWFKHMHVIQATILGFGIGIPVAYARPTPIVPYKLQWSADVSQYLRINQRFQYTGYMIVAPDSEYSLVLGSGYRMSQHELVTTYDPTKPPLTRYGSGTVDLGIAQDVFIYDFKHIFEVQKTNQVYPLEAPIYAQERKDRTALNAWVQRYKMAHHGIDVYYHGPELTIYHIHEVVPQN